jgi:hypothetical protein
MVGCISSSSAAAPAVVGELKLVPNEPWAP